MARWCTTLKGEPWGQRYRLDPLTTGNDRVMKCEETSKRKMGYPYTQLRSKDFISLRRVQITGNPATFLGSYWFSWWLIKRWRKTGKIKRLVRT